MSQIRFDNNSSGYLIEDSGSSQTYSIDFYYELNSQCDNQNPNSDSNYASTFLYYTINGGANWTLVDSVSSEVHNGYGEFDSDFVSGTITFTGITSISNVGFSYQYDCSYTSYGQAGSVFIKISNVSVDTGSSSIACNNYLYADCQISGVDCDIAPVTTTTTTAAPTTTTTTTTTAPVSVPELDIQPSGVSYNRSPIIYKFTNVKSDYTYKFELYIGSTKSNTALYASIDKIVDTVDGGDGSITIDVSNLLYNYTKNNMLYTYDNIYYFNGKLKEYYANGNLRYTTNTDYALTTAGYLEYDGILSNLKSGDIVIDYTGTTTTTTTTTAAPTTTTTTTAPVTTTTTTYDGRIYYDSYWFVISGCTSSGSSTTTTTAQIVTGTAPDLTNKYAAVSGYTGFHRLFKGTPYYTYTPSTKLITSYCDTCSGCTSLAEQLFIPIDFKLYNTGSILAQTFIGGSGFYQISDILYTSASAAISGSYSDIESFKTYSITSSGTYYISLRDKFNNSDYVVKSIIV